MELGNQQERLEAELNWLGGFFDGEGSFAIAATRRPYLWFTSFARVINTSEIAIEAIHRILNEHEVPHHIASLKPSKLGNRPTKHVHVAGFGRLEKFISLLRPYIRLKGKEADLLSEFIALRRHAGKHGRYGNREIDIYVELRLLHGQKLRESPETIRRGLLEARYSPISARKAERATEMSAPVP